MSKVNWKQVVAAAAPTLAAVLGGPMAGGAVKILADLVLGGSSGDLAKDEVALQQALSGGLTPELKAKLVEGEQAVRMAMVQAKTDALRIELDRDKAVLGDVSDARKAHAGSTDVMRLAVCVLLTWSVLTGGTLWGLFALMQGEITIKDASMVGVIFTLLGSTIGYVSNSAQQVISFFFGSSRGSLEKTVLMSDAIKGASR